MTTTDDQKPKDITEANSSAGVSCAAASGYAEPPMKVSDALPEMLLAMDAMWGALNAAEEVLETLIDCNDGRLLTMINFGGRHSASPANQGPHVNPKAHQKHFNKFV
jgi:hypothetical protein